MTDTVIEVTHMFPLVKSLNRRFKTGIPTTITQNRELTKER